MKTIIRWIALIFGNGGKSQKNNLQSISPEDIRREKIKVEQTESRLTREIDELEDRKSALFKKGTSAQSDRQRLQIARKIKELDSQTQARDQQLKLISRNLRVLNGISQLKENERVVRDLGMESIVNNMDLSELHEYVEKATVEGQFQMEKFNEILTSIEGAEKIYDVEGDDDDVMQLVEAMSRAQDNMPEVAPSDLEDGIPQSLPVRES